MFLMWRFPSIANVTPFTLHVDLTLRHEKLIGTRDRFLDPPIVDGTPEIGSGRVAGCQAVNFRPPTGPQAMGARVRQWEGSSLLAVERWHEFPEFGGYLGNVGPKRLRFLSSSTVSIVVVVNLVPGGEQIQRRLAD